MTKNELRQRKVDENENNTKGDEQEVDKKVSKEWDSLQDDWNNGKDKQAKSKEKVVVKKVVKVKYKNKQDDIIDWEFLMDPFNQKMFWLFCFVCALIVFIPWYTGYLNEWYGI